MNQGKTETFYTVTRMTPRGHDRELFCLKESGCRADVFNE